MAEANTAFQAELQRGSSQKRINVWLLNRDLANERFADLYKDLLQTYFPRKTADGLYPQVEVEDEAIIAVEGESALNTDETTYGNPDTDASDTTDTSESGTEPEPTNE
mgnify:CR=1 FL=1